MRYLYLFLLSLLSSGVYAQWAQNDDFPGGSRMAHTSFVLDDQLHVLGGLKLVGSIYEAYDDFRVYDAINDTWVVLDDFPGGTTYGGFGVVIDQTAYIGLGADESGALSNEVWSYNGTNGWTQLSNFPGIRRVYPFQFVADGKAYIGTGYGTNYLQDVWEYDPTSDEWTKMGNYPGGGRVGVVAFAVGDKGYAGCGDDGNSFFFDFLEYDPGSDTWTSKTAFPGENASFASGLGVYDKGYLIGGEYAHLAYTNEMWSYDPASDEWSSAWDFEGIPRRYGVFHFVDGTFYYGLGQIGPNDNNVTDDFWEIETDIINGLAVASMQTTRLYPNPVSDRLVIESEQYIQLSRVKVYSALGALIFEGTDAVLDTSNWPSQVYTVCIISEEKTEIYKVVKP